MARNLYDKGDHVNKQILDNQLVLFQLLLNLHNIDATAFRYKIAECHYDEERGEYVI
jgi:hypothetical protein